MNAAPLKSPRILSIDIMRGLTLFLMLFVNDLYEKGVPKWMLHTDANFDGMGLADWVFPGFLFMVGMSIPYAIGARLKSGEPKLRIFGHIILRTLSLLLIGVLMLNSGRVNPELTGISKNLWAILMYVSVFLVWNKYPEKEKLKNIFKVLRLLGVLTLIALAVIFRSDETGNVTWFVTSWWGILGLIGWGYLVAAMANLLIGSGIIPTVGLWLFFLILNILSSSGLLGFLDFLNPVFGVIIQGNVPLLVLTGLVVSLFLKQSSIQPTKTAGFIFLFGILSIAIGSILNNWFIISKILATPSWGMICNGISMVVFAIIYVVVDIYRKDNWAIVFKPAGQNSLTTYLAPDIIYHLIWAFSLPVFFYKQETSQWLAVCGSMGWALAMVGLTALLAKVHVRLKL